MIYVFSYAKIAYTTFTNKTLFLPLSFKSLPLSSDYLVLPGYAQSSCNQLVTEYILPIKLLSTSYLTYIVRFSNIFSPVIYKYIRHYTMYNVSGTVHNVYIVGLNTVRRDICKDIDK